MAHDNDIPFPAESEEPKKGKKGRKPVTDKKKYTVMLHLTEGRFQRFDAASGNNPVGPSIADWAELGLDKSQVPWDKIIDILGRMFLWLSMRPKDANPTQEQLEAIWNTHILGRTPEETP